MPSINEINRLVVEFKPIIADRNLWPITDQSQIWLVLEQHNTDTTPVWRMLNKDIDEPYSLIQGICSEEAIQAEMNERTCSGKHVNAEAYIGLWRSEMLKGISFTDIATRGMFLRATFTNSTQHLLGIRGEKSIAEHVLNSPYLVKKDDVLCTWEFNLDCLAACEIYDKLSRLRSYIEPFSDLYSRKFSFLFTRNVDATARRPSPAVIDLFSESEVSA